MNQCDLTLPSPEENLACDEALLDMCEAGGTGEVLRFWEPSRYFVVVGYANHVDREVNVAFCRGHGMPILRRCSGGGTVLQGPGCLNYSLVLDIRERSQLQSIPATNDYILERHRECLTELLGAPVEKQGHTDLAIAGLKFSGNAQRRRKNSLLFHGSFLLDLDISLVEKALLFPSQQPEYRLNRSHLDFLLNLKVPAALVKAALVKTWKAVQELSENPVEEVSRLAREKYCREDWNLKF